MARVEAQRLPGPAGEIPLRVYYPRVTGPLPTLVYLHGGGWILGNLDSHDKIMRRLALGSGAAVVGVDYRLAPEHKFPTALEESLAVIRHLAAEGARWDLDPARLAVGGDSAGANMSLAAGLTLRDEGLNAVRALLLFYGDYGLRDSASRRKYGGPEDGMGAEDLAYYMTCLVRGPEDLKDPRLDLLSAELSGLPPAFIIAAAELDPLHDDSLVLAELLADTGVGHRLEVYRGVLHGFLHLSRMVDQAGQALDDASRWLAETLQGPTPLHHVVRAPRRA